MTGKTPTPRGPSARRGTAATEPGRDDREDGLAPAGVAAVQLAATEPGRDDREDGLTRTAPDPTQQAATEPGRDDREDTSTWTNRC